MRGTVVPFWIISALYCLGPAMGAQAQDARPLGGTGQTAPAPRPDPGPGPPAPGPRVLFAGGMMGYENGLGFQGFLLAQDFAQGFPLKARIRLGFAAVEPGEPLEARRIFINDATNGTPREQGRTLDLGLDGLLPWRGQTHLYGGVRYTRFRANFHFVGGNEDFDVTSSHWGVAAGLEGSYPMGPRTALVLTGGMEYFFAARISGHDTSYSPDGDHVNPRKEYSYDDADAAVKQPGLRPVLMMGFSYRLGR